MRGELTLEKINKTQEIKEKLEYIGLNLEEIPETLKRNGINVDKEIEDKYNEYNKKMTTEQQVEILYEVFKIHKIYEETHF